MSVLRGFLRVVRPAASVVAEIPRKFAAYPKFALEFARPALPPPILGFGVPGGMRNERPRRL